MKKLFGTPMNANSEEGTKEKDIEEKETRIEDIWKGEQKPEGKDVLRDSEELEWNQQGPGHAATSRPFPSSVTCSSRYTHGATH